MKTNNFIKYMFLSIFVIIIIIIFINNYNSKGTYSLDNNYDDDKIYFLKVDATTSDSIIIKTSINNEAHCAVVDMMNPSDPNINNQVDANAEIYYDQTTGSYNFFCSSKDNGIKTKEYLTAAGCTHVDFVIFTHNHSDHIGGAAILATSPLIDRDTILFYKHDVMAMNSDGSIYDTDGKYVDKEEREGWKNNELLAKSLEEFNKKNVKLCDVSVGCNLSSISNDYITNVGSIPNSIDKYKTNVDYTYYFSFGNFKVNLYNLYHISNNRENMNSIVTLLTHANGAKVALLADQETSVHEYDRSGDTTMQGIIEVPTEDPNYPGECSRCMEIGVENQVADAIEEVDLVKAAHHGYDSSNSYYSMFKYNPKYIIVPARTDDVSSTKAITAIAKLLAKSSRHTETYYTGQSDGSVVAIFENQNKGISIKNYTSNATLSTSSSLTNFSTTNSNGWFSMNNLTMQDKKYIYLQDGSFTYDFKNIDNYWYYFDDDGIMATGWRYLNYNDTGYYWYYFTENGNTPKGSMQIGWQTIGGNTYYFRKQNNEYGTGPSGSMIKGLNTIDGKTYYFRNTKDDISAGPEGSMVKGFAKINNYWYYFDDDGIMVTGWRYLNYNDTGYYWYYFTEDGNTPKGSMQIGWQTIGGNTYYFRKQNNEYGTGPSGSMIKGLNTIDGKTYYFRNAKDDISAGPEGSMVINQCVLVNNKNYCFDENGIDTNNEILTVKNYTLVDNCIIDIAINTNVENLNIDLSGEYTYNLFDKNNNLKTSGKIATGDIIEIYLDGLKMTEFIVSIKGDVSGDGDVNSSDLFLIAKYIIDKNNMFDKAYLLAADYNIDGEIKMNDIMKILIEG